MGQEKSKLEANAEDSEAQYSVRNPGAIQSTAIVDSPIRPASLKIESPNLPSSASDSPEPGTSKTAAKATVDDFELLSVVGRGQWGKVVLFWKP